MKINIVPFNYDVYGAKKGTNIYNNKLGREIGYRVEISETYFNLSKEEMINKLIEDLNDLSRQIKISSKDDSKDMSCIDLKREIVKKKK